MTEVPPTTSTEPTSLPSVDRKPPEPLQPLSAENRAKIERRFDVLKATVIDPNATEGAKKAASKERIYLQMDLFVDDTLKQAQEITDPALTDKAIDTLIAAAERLPLIQSPGILQAAFVVAEKNGLDNKVWGLKHLVTTCQRNIDYFHLEKTSEPWEQTTIPSPETKRAEGQKRLAELRTKQQELFDKGLDSRDVQLINISVEMKTITDGPQSLLDSPGWLKMAADYKAACDPAETVQYLFMASRAYESTGNLNETQKTKDQAVAILMEPDKYQFIEYMGVADKTSL